MRAKGKRRRGADNAEPPAMQRKCNRGDRHFWTLACAVLLVLALARTFDYSLVPPSYEGVFITRPYGGLHSDAAAAGAWAARSHLKYGLGYTKGYRTLVVGDPPPAYPPSARASLLPHPNPLTTRNAPGGKGVVCAARIQPSRTITVPRSTATSPVVLTIMQYPG